MFIIKVRANVTENVAMPTGVNKTAKIFKIVLHGVRGVLKPSGWVYQASLKLSTGFPNTVSWTFLTFFMLQIS